MLDIDSRAVENPPMFSTPARIVTHRLAALLLVFTCLNRVCADPTGPTLSFDYGSATPQANPLFKFMYFVPLISPELITVSTNTGNTQCARVTSRSVTTIGKSFEVTCEFEFAGTGVQRDLFDHTPGFKRHEQELKDGKTLSHQIMAISVEGCGQGKVDIAGDITNGLWVVNEIKMHFNSHGNTSPVNIDLQDISLNKGCICYDNEYVARVNTLTFHRKDSDPRMDVSLDSIKRKGADSPWSNFWGGFKGMAANVFMPPIKVTPEGNQTMLDFGDALANQKPSFTFPFASRLVCVTNAP